MSRITPFRSLDMQAFIPSEPHWHPSNAPLYLEFSRPESRALRHWNWFRFPTGAWRGPCRRAAPLRARFERSLVSACDHCPSCSPSRSMKHVPAPWRSILPRTGFPVPTPPPSVVMPGRERSCSSSRGMILGPSTSRLAAAALKPRTPRGEHRSQEAIANWGSAHRLPRLFRTKAALAAGTIRTTLRRIC